jgi:hypothetical protein
MGFFFFFSRNNIKQKCKKCESTPWWRRRTAEGKSAHTHAHNRCPRRKWKGMVPPEDADLWF